MANDIVTRLRDDESVFVDTELLHEAAAEIERLREQLDYRDDVISMLRSEVARLGAFLHPIGEKARRG